MNIQHEYSRSTLLGLAEWSSRHIESSDADVKNCHSGSGDLSLIADNADNGATEGAECGEATTLHKKEISESVEDDLQFFGVAIHQNEATMKVITKDMDLIAYKVKQCLGPTNRHLRKGKGDG